MDQPAPTEVMPRSRRDEILVVAAQLFSERGYHATTVRDIAARCDLVVASLYSHFASKNEMLAELVVQYYAALLPEVDRIMATELDGLDKLLAMVQATLEVSLSRRLGFLALFNEWKQVAEAKQITSLVTDRDRCMEMTRAALRQGMADGSVRPDLDIDATLLVIVSGIAGIVEHRHEFAPLAKQVDPIKAYIAFLGRALR
jgi:TetR/AcrR family transcriptional regulator, cholesterol catabolism regulator